MSLVLGVFLVAPVLGSASFTSTPPKVPPCPPARYLLLDGGALPTDPEAAPGAIDVASDGRVALTGCPQGIARVRGRRASTRVVARFPACGTLEKVRLRAKIERPDCDVLNGRLLARFQLPRRVLATRSRCGDQRWDGAGGEVCDASAPGGDAACPERCRSCACGTGVVTTTLPPTTTTRASTTTTTTSTTRATTTTTSTTQAPPPTTTTTTSTTAAPTTSTTAAPPTTSTSTTTTTEPPPPSTTTVPTTTTTTELPTTTAPTTPDSTTEPSTSSTSTTTEEPTTTTTTVVDGGGPGVGPPFDLLGRVLGR